VGQHLFFFRSPRLVFVLLGVILLAQVERAEPVGSRGTLVSFVPANGALIVAADSRSTTYDVRCDNRIKLAIPKLPLFTIVGGTGTSEWILARVPLWPDDPCGDLEKNSTTFFDAKQLTVKYLEEKKQPLWSIDTNDFAAYMVKAILQAASENPSYVRGFAGKTMFQIVLGAFDPESSTSYVRAIQFNLTVQLAIEAKLAADYKFAKTDQPDYPHFGDTIMFTSHVMMGAGQRYLPASLKRIQSERVIEKVSIEDASDLAISMIEAAKRTSVDIPELRSIGGDVTAYIIDANGIKRIK